MNDPRVEARLVLLVTAVVFINYIDRGNLATAAPLIHDALRLNEQQLGVLFSAFYPTYVLCMPFTGWMAERFGAKRVLAAGITIWSLATLLTGFAWSFASLLALRLMLGIGESVAFPCASKVLANTVEVARLGVANGILSFGYLLGPAAGTFLGGMLMARYGWRPVFVVFGAVSLLWLWPWLRARVDAPAGGGAGARAGVGAATGAVTEAATGAAAAAMAPKLPVRPPALALILRQRALWGASVGHFAANYTYYFILSWLPLYLVKARGFSIGAMALIASWAYLLNAVSALGMGRLQDHWIRTGRSTTLVYKGVMGSSHAIAMFCMAGMVLLPEHGSVAALFVFCIVSGCSYPGLFAIPQIVAGPAATGSWVGFQNAAGNVAGMIAPAITGWLVFQTGHYELAFALAAIVNIFGFIGWVFVLPAVRPIDWLLAAQGRRRGGPVAG
jgi:MFS family permease